MSVITFWNDGREQSGKTLASVAAAISMAMERNCKILLLSTSIDDDTMANCFYGKEKAQVIFGDKNNTIAVENGLTGIMKLVTSNKLEPSVITDYTKVIFKNRLEVLTGYSEFNEATTIIEKQGEFNKYESCFIDLIRTANQYYDMVIVDLDKFLTAKTYEDILNMSDVNVYVFSQKMGSILKYKELKSNSNEIIKNRCIPLIGKYIHQYKYNSKNISRFLQERKEFDLLPFNLLYMAAAEEAATVDLFLKLKNVKDKTDENYIFMQSVQGLTNKIWKKLQDMKMRMRMR